MKTKEELTTLKEKVEATNKKFCELTEEELASVSGGDDREFCPDPCDGSRVGSCGFHGNCPYMYKG